MNYSYFNSGKNTFPVNCLNWFSNRNRIVGTSKFGEIYSPEYYLIGSDFQLENDLFKQQI